MKKSYDNDASGKTQSYSVKVRGTYGKNDRYINFSHELLDSRAYRSLSAYEQIILQDMIRVYYEKTAYDTKDIGPEGFHYTYNSCKIVVCQKTFRDAIKHICSHRFFVLLDSQRGLPNLYTSCTEWKDYECTDEEKKILEKDIKQKESVAEKNRCNRIKIYHYDKTSHSPDEGEVYIIE